MWDMGASPRIMTLTRLGTNNKNPKTHPDAVRYHGPIRDVRNDHQH
jgi:hypothetical protein